MHASEYPKLVKGQEEMVAKVLFRSIVAVIAMSVIIVLCVVISSGRNQVRQGVFAEPARIVVDGSVSMRQREDVKFRIENRSNVPVRIIEVKTKCGCMKPRDIAGTSIPEGEYCDLELEASVPRMGRANHAVEVHHDHDGSPLRLEIELLGHQPLPTLAESGPKDIVYVGVPSIDDARGIVIGTYKASGADRWLGDLVCSDGRVLTRLVSIDSAELDGNIVERKYKYAVRWKELPTSKEVRASLEVVGNYGVDRRVRVGSLVVYNRASSPFSPRVVALGQSRRKEKVLVSEVQQMSWSIANEAAIPEWIKVTQDIFKGAPLLIVEITDKVAKAESLEFDLQLEDREGKLATLPIKYLAD